MQLDALYHVQMLALAKDHPIDVEFSNAQHYLDQQLMNIAKSTL